MLKNISLLIVAVALCAFLFMPPEAGAEGIFFKDPIACNMDAPPDEIALKFLSEHGDLFNAGSVEELVWIKTHRLENISYVRFQQVHGGIAVDSAQVVLTIDGKGRIHQLSDSTLYPDILPEPGFCLTPEEAESVVLSSKVNIIADGAAGPLYIPGRDGAGAFLTMVVRVKSKDSFSLWEVYVDCSSSSIIGAKSLLISADGKVYDPNPVVNPTVETVTLNNLTSATNLEGTLARASACADSRCDTHVQRAVADIDGNFLYDPDEPSIEDAFSEVNGYYHTDKINRWFETELGYTNVCDGERFINILVNLDYPNAFYINDTRYGGCGIIVLGQDLAPPGIDFAYDGDVIYHEFTHGVVAYTAELWGIDVDGLGHDYSAGGLNEGTADFYSASLTDSSLLGEYALGSYGGELSTRNADNDKVCPDDLVGESHMDGEIWSGTLWEIRTAIGAHKTDQLGLAVLYSLSSNADFHEAGNDLITQAGVLEGDGTLDAGDAATVESITNSRGLPGCERIIFLEDEDTAMVYAEGLETYGGWVDAFTSGLQFAVEAPPGARRVIIRLFPLSAGADYDVYINHDGPVGYSRVGMINVNASDFEYVVTGSPSSVSWTEFSDPPVSPGTTYYISILSRSPYGLLLTLDTTVVVGPVVEPEPDDVVDAAEDVIEDEAAQEDPTEDISGDDVTEDETQADVSPDTREDPGQDAEEETDEGGGKGGCGCGMIL